MTRHDILEFMRSHSLAVQASVSPDGSPQAAVIGFIVTDDFEVVFDTVDTTRQVVNLRANARCAFVIGGMVNGDERTVQFEGITDEPTGADLERVKNLYFVRFPEGRHRQHWPGLIYLRVRPHWLRFSDFNQSPQAITEFTFEQKACAAGCQDVHSVQRNVDRLSLKIGSHFRRHCLVPLTCFEALTRSILQGARRA